MRQRSAPKPKAARKKSWGNAGSVERMESQKQASHSFHEPLGNLANSGRDSHISTAPATKADGNVQNPKQVFHVPHRHGFSFSQSKKTGPRNGLRPPLSGGPPAPRLKDKRELSTKRRNTCRHTSRIVDAGHATVKL